MDNKKINENKTIIDKRAIKNFAIDFLFLLLGCISGCFSTVAILLPNGLSMGGLTGIVRNLQFILPLKFSTIYYACSFLILLAVFIFLGFKEMRKLILLAIMYPTVLLIMEEMDISLLDKKDVILAVVFCGVFTGIASGVTIWRGYSFAGLDSISKIIKIKLFPQVAQSKIMLSLDTCVIIVSAFLYGRNIALYALVSTVIVSKTIDTVIYGLESQIVQMEIITKNRKMEIATYIMDEIGRGVSSEKITGMYTNEVYAKLRVMCTPRESFVIKKRLAKIDRSAFITVVKADNVWGAGRSFKNIYDE